MNQSASIPSSQFEQAIGRFDAENAQDPNQELVEGVPRPRELVYAQRLYDWVRKLCPDASEALLLAARCQHICRWMIPRKRYDMNRAGYLRWRNDLKKFHAEKSGEILRQTGYLEEMISKVQDLNLKKNFPHDPESRVLEDALCLVFLEHQFAELASRASDETMINALRKSWQKMSPDGRREALKLSFGPREQQLLRQALQEDNPA